MVYCYTLIYLFELFGQKFMNGLLLFIYLFELFVHKKIKLCLSAVNALKVFFSKLKDYVKLSLDPIQVK